MVVDVQGTVGAFPERGLHRVVIAVGGPRVVSSTVGAAEAKADGRVGVGGSEVVELCSHHAVGDVVGGAGQGGRAVRDHVDVRIDGVEAAGCLAGGVVRLRVEGCAVVEEHGGVPEGVVDGFMVVEVSMSGAKFRAGVGDRAVTDGEVVDRCRLCRGDQRKR